MGCKPGRITAGAGADIEDRCAGPGERVKQCGMDVLKCQRLVLRYQLGRILLVVGNWRHRVILVFLGKLLAYCKSLWCAYVVTIYRHLLKYAEYLCRVQK